MPMPDGTPTADEEAAARMTASVALGRSRAAMTDAQILATRDQQYIANHRRDAQALIDDGLAWLRRRQDESDYVRKYGTDEG